jgi:hypothetical protein
MILTLQQDKKDSKQDYLDTIDLFESLGYKVYDIGCYDTERKLSEAIMLKVGGIKWLRFLVQLIGLILKRNSTTSKQTTK